MEVQTVQTVSVIYPATIQPYGRRFRFVSWNPGMTRGVTSKGSWATAAYARKVARQTGHTVVEC